MEQLQKREKDKKAQDIVSGFLVAKTGVEPVTSGL